MSHSTFPRNLSTLVASATLAVLAACGGGGGSSGTTPPPGGGTTASAISYGTITAFGSVWVNGIEYETTGAEVRIDDSPRGTDDLRV
ncbi:MAG TPA: hypothetical protein PK129_15390, partial [Cellvibrionaceae bacterium]|nr:hypothetical protein [Cellvibrionaceae bacterium]